MIDKAMRASVFVPTKEYDSLKLDAERYRWLRESMNLDDPRREAHALACFVSDTAADMDAAIDAAMAEETQA